MRRSNILKGNELVSTSRLKIANKSNLSALDRTCILRGLGGIGDVLMATVAVREYKRENPNTQVIFAIDRDSTYDDTYYKLVKNADFIDKIISKKDLVKEKYREFYDITTCCIEEENSRPFPRGRISIFASACQVRRIENSIPFYLEEEVEANRCEIFLEKYKSCKRFFIHTASNEGKRSWPTKNILELIQLINAKYKNSVIFISDFNQTYSDWDIVKNVVNVSGWNIRECASLIKRCDLFIGPDSGLMHLAAAVETKSLVIFGSIPPESRISYYPTHESIRMDELACIGCWYKPCPYDTKCMKSLTAKRVFNKLEEMVNSV